MPRLRRERRELKQTHGWHSSRAEAWGLAGLCWQEAPPVSLRGSLPMPLPSPLLEMLDHSTGENRQRKAQVTAFPMLHPKQALFWHLHGCSPPAPFSSNPRLALGVCPFLFRVPVPSPFIPAISILTLGSHHHPQPLEALPQLQIIPSLLGFSSQHQSYLLSVI